MQPVRLLSDAIGIACSAKYGTQYNFVADITGTVKALLLLRELCLSIV